MAKGGTLVIAISFIVLIAIGTTISYYFLNQETQQNKEDSSRETLALAGLGALVVIFILMLIAAANRSRVVVKVGV